MNEPNFDRAEYNEPSVPSVIDGRTGMVEGSPRAAMSAFPLALVYGLGAAVVGAIGYGIISLSGFMVSIVAIGIGYIVGRAMMTATKGIGGRPYQIAAVLLTYFSCTFGTVLGVLWHAKIGLGVLARPAFWPLFGKIILVGPFTDFQGNGFSAAIGLLILFYGMRTAWQLAAGAPGFGQPGGPRMTILGMRR